MYDETSTITTTGDRVPFSGSLKADKKSVATEFITREYKAPTNGNIVLKFENLGDSDIEVEYNSGGHRVKLL